ncbi:hypothetical protein BH10ACT3_BH10ACT3_00750 [soil metagenome]
MLPLPGPASPSAPSISRTRRRLGLSVVVAGLLGALAACAPTPPAAPAVPASSEVVVKPITFPVSGGARYADSFGAPRSGGRSHEGQDLPGAKGTPLVAAVSGVVIRVRHDVSGLSGNSLTIKGDDGWTYVYIHLNNDTPGTDDGVNAFEYAFAPGLAVNTRVAAGQFVGYMGDSGNAEDAGSHLHFEIHKPDGTVVNAHPSLQAATAAPTIPRSW